MTIEQRFTRLLILVFSLNGLAIGLFALGAFLELAPAVTWTAVTLLWVATAVLLWGIRRTEAEKRRRRDEIMDWGGGS